MSNLPDDINQYHDDHNSPTFNQGDGEVVTETSHTTVNADLETLYYYFRAYATQQKCRCGHPTCASCQDDKENENILDQIEEKYKL